MNGRKEGGKKGRRRVGKWDINPSTILTFHIKQQKNEMKRVMKEERNAVSIGIYGYFI